MNLAPLRELALDAINHQGLSTKMKEPAKALLRSVDALEKCQEQRNAWCGNHRRETAEFDKTLNAILFPEGK